MESLAIALYFSAGLVVLLTLAALSLRRLFDADGLAKDTRRGLASLRRQRSMLQRSRVPVTDAMVYLRTGTEELESLAEPRLRGLGSTSEAVLGLHVSEEFLEEARIRTGLAKAIDAMISAIKNRSLAQLYDSEVQLAEIVVAHEPRQSISIAKNAADFRDELNRSASLWQETHGLARERLQEWQNAWRRGDRLLPAEDLPLAEFVVKGVLDLTYGESYECRDPVEQEHADNLVGSSLLESAKLLQTGSKADKMRFICEMRTRIPQVLRG